jgi:hypothetical protein
MGGVNQIAYWSHLPDRKNQTLTSHPDAIYFMPFFRTKDVKPIVIEVCTAKEDSITGSIMGYWRVTLEDAGE